MALRLRLSHAARFHAWFPSVAALALLSSATPSATADEAPPHQPAATETIQVTAARTPSTAADQFIAIDAPSAEDQEVIDVSQTSRQAPSLLAKTSTGVPLAARLFLRQPTPDSGNYFTSNAAPTYVDGVYYNKPFGALYDFIDLDRIDVIPTAQGTLFGRNTVDGATLITTRQPGSRLAFTGDVAYGTNNWFDVRGAISGPIIEDKLAASLSGLSRQRDGLVDDTALGKHVNDRDYQAGRAKLLFTPTQDFDLTVSADMLRDRSTPKYPSALSTFAPGQDPAATPGRDIFTTEAVTPDLNRVDQEGVAIVGNYRFEAVALKSITSYRDIASSSYVTYDATPANTLSTAAFVHQNELVEDLSVHRGNDGLEGTAGLFFLRRDTKQWTPTGSSPNFSRELKYSYAGYASVTAKVTDTVEIVGGIRYTVEPGDFSSWFYAGNKKATLKGVAKNIPASATPPQADSQTGYGVTPRIGVNLHITPDLLAFFSYTKGYKAGGWNNRLPPNYGPGGIIDGRPIRYLPESVNQYELGAKTDFLDHALKVNVAAYIHDYTNLQIPVLLYNSSTSYLTSAPGAQITGLEIDANWQLTHELQAYGLLDLQHGHYDRGFLCQNIAGATVDCSANKLIGLAPLRALGGLVYAPSLPIPGQLRLSFSANYSDKYQNSVAGVALAATTSHTLFDASVNYELDAHWNFSLEGRNLTDVHWFSTAQQNGNAVVVYPDDPRMVVFRARYKY